MFHPFRNEYKEITTQDLRIKFNKIENDELEHEKLKSQIKFYQPYQDLLNGIEEYIKQQQEDEEIEDNDNYEDEDGQFEEEDDDLKLETT